MTAGPSGPQDPIQQTGQAEQGQQAEQAEQAEPVGSGLMEGTGSKRRDSRIGLVIACIAGAALLVGGLIALVITMAG
ncbi:hypothetical protein GCM10022399_21000 [Terrabacter ginsenosidimutans]|jgi:hypothetical protein|uniref:Uncharacterized protein n=1 Tax=Terrabacter ginsenosidimutans TaxID=490575 RepID=A0ABP7DGZ4_9MICO